LKELLVSGFEPFGGERVNPSALVAAELSGLEVAPGYRVRSVTVPVTWAGALPALLKALGAGPSGFPAAVVMLGQAGGYAAIGLERVAVNISSGTDNDGVPRADEPVVEGGPASYLSGLPLRAIVARLGELGLPAFVSNSAGTYLCNFLFYGALHHLAGLRESWRGASGSEGRGAGSSSAPAPLAGFIHIPYLPEQAVGKNPIPPSMSRGDIVRAVRVALEVTAASLGNQSP
jgi:pyroglutamyl-peptidase